MRRHLIVTALFFLAFLSSAQADQLTESVQQKLKEQGFYYGEITGEKGHRHDRGDSPLPDSQRAADHRRDQRGDAALVWFRLETGLHSSAPAGSHPRSKDGRSKGRTIAGSAERANGAAPAARGAGG